jgi:hypothetical protein
MLCHDFCALSKQILAYRKASQPTNSTTWHIYQWPPDNRWQYHSIAKSNRIFLLPYAKLRLHARVLPVYKQMPWTFVGVLRYMLHTSLRRSIETYNYNTDGDPVLPVSVYHFRSVGWLHCRQVVMRTVADLKLVDLQIFWLVSSLPSQTFQFYDNCVIHLPL